MVTLGERGGGGRGREFAVTEVNAATADTGNTT
jgi:hypothetical protein